MTRRVAIPVRVLDAAWCECNRRLWPLRRDMARNRHAARSGAYEQAWNALYDELIAAWRESGDDCGAWARRPVTAWSPPCT